MAVNSGLGLKLSQDAKAKGNESADKNSIVKKGDALAYGILYCGGPNFAKVKALFNIFSENKELKSNEKFSNFLLSLFIIPSYGMANARNKLSKFDEIGAVDKEKFKEILDSSELKDCQNLVVVANNGKRGYMNRYTGEMVIPYKYAHAWVFSDDMAAVVNDDDAILFINREGKRVMNKVFDYYPSLQFTGYVFHYDHCVMAQAEDSVGLIDRNGEWAVKPEWRQILWRDFYWELRTADKIMLLGPDLKPIMPAVLIDALTKKPTYYQYRHAEKLPPLV